MSESQNKSSSAVNSKEQDSLFDMDIGNEFLNFWKPKPVADGDGLDFDLPQVSKGNKKALNFEKVDIDFNLNDDFSKMTSFNFDTDLDISPPFKKDGNSKEQKKENSSSKGGLKFQSIDMDMSDFDMIPSSPPSKKDGKGEEKSKEQKDKGKEYLSGKAGMEFSSFDMDMPDFDISPPLKKDGKSQTKEPSKQNDKGEDPFGFAFDFDGLDNFKFEPSLGKKGSESRKDKVDMENWENFNFEPSSTKEGSKAQKDKDSTESPENHKPDASLVKEDLKARKDKDSTESLETFNVGPSLPEEGSKSQRHTDNVECSQNRIFESGLATEGSKTVNDKVGIEGLGKFSSQRSSVEDEPRKYQDNTENPFHGSGCQNMKASALEKLYGSMCTMRDLKKPSSLRTAGAFDKDGQVGGSAHVEPTRRNNPSKLAFEDPVTSTSSISPEEVSFDKAKTCPETLIVSTEPPKLNQPDTFGLETTLGNDANVSYNPIRDNFDSARSSSSDAPEKNDIKGRSSNCSVEGKNVNETEAGSTCNYKRTMSKTSPHFPTVAISEKDIKEKSHGGIENDAIQNKEKTDHGNSNVQDPGISVITSHEPTNRENQEHASVFFKQDSVRNQESNQCDKEIASLHMQLPKMLLNVDLPQAESRESYRGLECGEKVSDNVGVQKMKNNDSFTPSLDLLKAKPTVTVRQTGTSVKGLDTTISSSLVQPRSKMEMSRKTAQTSKVPFTLASLPATKRTSAETVKLHSAEGSKRTPELCGLKISTINLDSSKSPSQIGMTSIETTRLKSGILRNSPKSFSPDASWKKTLATLSLNQTSLLSRKTPKEIVPRDDSKKQTPPLPLKRKTLEGYSADKFVFYPSKRISQSPTLNRNFMATPERAYDKRVDSGIENAFGASKVSAADILHKVNNRALEMSVYIENDSNIKQAAAYTKELDDICNMLRSKQEEAKELMVRATVNSNKLLMLNYPLLEQKIGMVGSFASLSLKK